MGTQHYRVDIRLVQVVTLLGVVSVTAPSADEAVLQARRSALDGGAVIIRSDGPAVTVGYEVLKVAPDSKWDGQERRAHPRE